MVVIGSGPVGVCVVQELRRHRPPKHQTRWAGFDDTILSLYARGMTVREIQAHLQGKR